MLKNQLIVVLLAALWLGVTAFMTVATVTIGVEDGWSEVPPWAWVADVLLYGVALPGLMFGWYKWGNLHRRRAAGA